MEGHYRLGRITLLTDRAFPSFVTKTLMIIAFFFLWAIKEGKICKELGPSLLVHSLLPHMQYQDNVRLCLLKGLDNLNLLFSTWKELSVFVYLKVKISKGPWIIIYCPCCHYSQLPRHRKHSIKFSSRAVCWWIQREISLENRMTSNLPFSILRPQLSSLWKGISNY